MSLQKKIYEIAENVFSRFNTISLGVITEFDPKTMRASGFLKLDKDAIFSKVPVLSFRGGLSEFLVPIEKGDVVMVLYNKEPISGALEDEKEVISQTNSTFRGLIDAVILPGIFTKSNLKKLPKWNNDKIYIRTNRKVEIDSANTITFKFKRFPWRITF
ncbi:MAG TPA: hypothetical protein EYP30_04005 [Archaeoglobaceae archaeon]|nr:hypothetical protein [Archaeoglobaceae archaeon]